jgi:hypothetical protein
MTASFETAIGCLIAIWMSATIIFLGVVLSKTPNVNTHIFTVGPNPDFYILGICINNFSKYGITVSFCFINSGMRALKGNALNSWVINEIQDVKNTNIVSHNKAVMLSSISVIYNWFDFFMYINILLSQIDMLLFEIFADLIVTYYLTRHYLHSKVSTNRECSFSNETTFGRFCG